MITVGTTLNFWLHKSGEANSAKRVVVHMSGDDAFALATILMNNQMEISDDWKQAISKFASELVTAGNTSR